jgi:HlyD family secretion protein
VERAKESHELAKHVYDRAAGLRRSGAVSQDDFDRAEHDERLKAQAVRSAQFALRVGEYELEVARAAFIRVQPDNGEQGRQGLKLLSPVDGLVLRIHQESATVVAPGTPLIELGDPQDMEIVVDVLSSDAARIQPGDRVILEHWGGLTPLAGQVRVVEPSGFTKVSSLGIEEQRVNVIADFVGRQRAGNTGRRIPRWGGLLFGSRPPSRKWRRGALPARRRSRFGIENNRATLPQDRHNNGVMAEVLRGFAGTVILHPGDKNQGVRVTRRR